MLRTRITAGIAAIACSAGGTAAVATASASTTRTASAAGALKLSIKPSGLGHILVQNGGLVVFMFSHDRKNKNTCPASNGCSSVWPPLLSSGKPAVGPGVKKSLIGLIKHGRQYQVTYAGHPLYNYIENSTSTSYVGFVQFGGTWEALSPSGKPIK